MHLQQILRILNQYIPDTFWYNSGSALGPCSVGAANGDNGTRIGTHAFTNNSRTISAIWFIALISTFLADQISFGEGPNLYIFMGGDRLSLDGNAGYFEFYCTASSGYAANHIETIYF